MKKLLLFVKRCLNTWVSVTSIEYESKVRLVGCEFILQLSCTFPFCLILGQPQTELCRGNRATNGIITAVKNPLVCH